MKENLKLLIIDDDKDLLRQLEFLLEDDFEKILTASSKKEALELKLELELKSEQIEVFLVDVRLNEKDSSDTQGLELAKEFHKKNSKAIIIMMSRYDLEKYKKTLINEKLKLDGFLRKPFTMDEFIEMVMNIKKEKKCSFN
jgi:DNA-binding NtrC family response regulator